MSTIKNRIVRALVLTSLVASASLSSPTVPGPIRYYSTIKSIGIEWDITGDTNHNATCSAQYRKSGAAAWNDFIPLFRVDFRGWMGTDSADRKYNMLAGSVMFLDSATTYEVKLGLRDTDGGNKDTTLTVATRPVPAQPAGGRTLYVTTGSGGGDGSAANPFKGLAAAQSAAQPGDIFMVGPGSYGNFTFNKSGSAAGYVVWKAADAAVLSYGRIAGHHIWLYGLQFANSASQTYALVGQSGSVSNVVTRCSFTGFNYAVTLQSGSDDWYIADNTIVGDKTNVRVPGDFEGEGIELEHTSGHTVCHNTISRVADGVSYANRNCDIFCNDIFDVVDDGVEPDYGYANIRVWQNRITNPRNHGLSLQPMYCGPWYFVRNQVLGAGCCMLKYRVVDRLVIAHNTFVGWNTLNIYDQNVLSALSRNNLWIQAGGSGYIWEAMPCSDCTQPERWTPDWRTDVDRDGFDPGASNPAFKWFNPAQRFATVAAFAAAAGIEKNAVAVSKTDLFDSLVAFNADSLFSRTCLTLRPGCAAIDKGAALPGINQQFSGNGPDLGAYERDLPLPHYGVRPEGGSALRFARAPLDPRPGLRVAAAGKRVRISCRTPVPGNIDVAIYSVAGSLVKTLYRGTPSGQTITLCWQAPGRGVYIVRSGRGTNSSTRIFSVR